MALGAQITSCVERGTKRNPHRMFIYSHSRSTRHFSFRIQIFHRFTKKGKKEIIAIQYLHSCCFLRSEKKKSLKKKLSFFRQRRDKKEKSNIGHHHHLIPRTAWISSARRPQVFVSNIYPHVSNISARFRVIGSKVFIVSLFYYIFRKSLNAYHQADNVRKLSKQCHMHEITIASPARCFIVWRSIALAHEKISLVFCLHNHNYNYDVFYCFWNPQSYCSIWIMYKKRQKKIIKIF